MSQENGPPDTSMVVQAFTSKLRRLMHHKKASYVQHGHVQLCDRVGFADLFCLACLSLPLDASPGRLPHPAGRAAFHEKHSVRMEDHSKMKTAAAAAPLHQHLAELFNARHHVPSSCDNECLMQCTLVLHKNAASRIDFPVRIGFYTWVCQGSGRGL